MRSFPARLRVSGARTTRLGSESSPRENAESRRGEFISMTNRRTIEVDSSSPQSGAEVSVGRDGWNVHRPTDGGGRTSNRSGSVLRELSCSGTQKTAHGIGRQKLKRTSWAGVRQVRRSFGTLSAGLRTTVGGKTRSGRQGRPQTRPAKVESWPPVQPLPSARLMQSLPGACCIQIF